MVWLGVLLKVIKINRYTEITDAPNDGRGRCLQVWMVKKVAVSPMWVHSYETGVQVASGLYSIIFRADSEVFLPRLFW